MASAPTHFTDVMAGFLAVVIAAKSPWYERSSNASLMPSGRSRAAIDREQSEAIREWAVLLGRALDDVGAVDDDRAALGARCKGGDYPIG